MTEIEVTGTVAKIIPPRDTYTQGQLGTARLHFTFDAAWQGYTDLKAIFDCGVASADAAIVNYECTVPQDVLATPYRIISISISGNDGTSAISTAWVRLGQVLPSGTSGGGGRFVTFDELAQMLLDYVTFGDLDDYVTKAELAAAIADLAKKDELDALTAAFDALVLAVDDKADKSELDKYVLKSIYEDFVQSVNDALDLKANLADVWKKSEITLVTSGDGKSFLGNDGQYHVIQGGSGDAKAFIAEYNVTTAQEIIDFIDASNEPYAPMQVKRAGSYYTVVTAVKQDTDKVIIRTFGTHSGNYYMFTYTITGNVWASASYGFQPTLVSGTNIKTINGESILGSGNIEVQGGTQTQADWNETDTTKPAYIKNKPDIPDVSGFATKESVQAVSDTVSTLSGTVINQGVAIQNLSNEKADKATLADYATTEYVDGNFAKTTDIPDVSGFETTAHANATFATKDALTTGLAGKVDTATLDDYETSAHADATFAKKTDVPIFAHTDTPEAAGLVKKDTWTINGETKQTFEFLRAAALSGECVYTTTDGTKCRLVTADEFEVWGVTKDELSAATDACWKKSEIGLETTGTGTLFLANDGTYRPASGDPPDLTPYLKKTEAENIYATIANHNALADRVTAVETDIDNLETDVAALKTGHVKSVTASGFTVTPDTNGNVDVGGTDVSRVTTSGSWGAETTYTISQTLPAGATSDTKGKSLTIFKRTENSGANPHIIMKIDGVQIATYADIPNVSYFATLDYVQNNYESTAHASATYRKIVDATDVTTQVSFNGSTGASNFSGKIAQTTGGDENFVSVGGTIGPRGNSFTTGIQFTVNNGSNPAVFYVPTMVDMTEALATKADATAVADMLTKTEAASTYETQTHADETYLKKADASEIKTIKSAKHTVTVENGVADIGGTTVSRDNSQTSTNSYSVVTVKQNLPATADATGDEGASFVISKAGTLQGQWQNISIDGVNVVTTYELNLRIANLLSKTEAETTYLKIADASPIKSISQGGTATTPDANGNVNVRFVYVAAGSNSGKKTLFVRSTTDNINYGDNLIVEFAETGGKQSDCEMYAQYTDENTQGSKGNPVRIATKDELTTATTDMATQTWVQQYVASLDGTNISA